MTTQPNVKLTRVQRCKNMLFHYMLAVDAAEKGTRRDLEGNLCTPEQNAEEIEYSNQLIAYWTKELQKAVLERLTTEGA